jgi:2-polyprenyl-6-methoxyphenol hydroxylase-like FAD-dependent oxidoreductase
VGYVWFYGDGAAAGLIPTNDGQTCVFVATTPERMRGLRARSAEAAFRALLNVAAPEHAAQVADAEPAGPFHGWGGVPGYARRSWGPGWALVGDAGYFKDPISAHGISDALRDAELASIAVLGALGGERTERTAFGEYQLRRDTVSRRLFQVSDQISSYAWDGAAAQPLLRAMSSAMTDEVELLSSLPALPSRPAAPVTAVAAAVPGLA